MIVLALDPATRTGWAICRVSERNIELIDSGFWCLAAKKKQNVSMRFLNLKRKLDVLSESHGTPDVIVYENPGNLHGHARKILPGLQAIIETWCLEQGVQFYVVRPTEVKRYATGSGSAEKDRMLKAAREKWPSIEIAEHDHADALWILDFFLSTRKK